MDTVARIGGDEFVVLAPDVDSQLHAVDIGSAAARRARPRGPDARRRRARRGEHRHRGLGRRARDGRDLLNEADTAMYQAKSLGGGRVEVFDAALGRQVQQRSVARSGCCSRRSTSPGRRPLPADRRSRHRQRRRLRGARPDRASRRLDPPAGGLHPGRRGERARRAARRAGARASRCARRARWPADGTAAPADRRRQPLRAPVRARRPAGARRRAARAHRAGPELPAPRAHRDRDHGPAPRPARPARPDPRPRRADRPRRLRHRLRLAHPPAPPAADAS